MTELAKACAYYRARNKLTQVEFAKICGIDRTTLIRAETGKKISAVTEAKIRIQLDNE